MINDRIVKKRVEWKPIYTTLAGKPKTRWGNDVKEDLRIMKINKSTKRIQDRVKWKVVVENARTLKQ
jgi:hypothetical protein